MESTSSALAVMVLSSSLSLVVGSDAADIDIETAIETVSPVVGIFVGALVGRRLLCPVDVDVGSMDGKGDG